MNYGQSNKINLSSPLLAVRLAAPVLLMMVVLMLALVLVRTVGVGGKLGEDCNIHRKASNRPMHFFEGNILALSSGFGRTSESTKTQVL